MLSEKQYDQIKKKNQWWTVNCFTNIIKKTTILIKKQSKNWMTLNKIIFKKYY
jgi:hypothetical protein